MTRPTTLPASLPASLVAHLATLTDATFDEALIAADRPVLVDFAAEWCPPCRMLEPVLKALAAESGDRLSIVHVDVDQSPGLSARFSVMAMPTLVLFVHGTERRRFVGARSKAQLVRELGEALAT